MLVNEVKIKCKLTEMLSWFHEFCEENGLRYYVVGGTMLGVSRHGGFIPWDDDIDVAMPRKDYIKLEKLLAGITGRYVLETPHSTNEDYLYPSAKLYDAETTLIENTRCKIKRGIYLDIFPLDGAGESLGESKVYFRKLIFLKKVLLTITTGIRKGRNPLKNLAVRIMRNIPNCVLDKKKLLLYLDSCCSQKDFDQCEWGGNLVGNWLEREIMPRSYFGEPQLYKFEGIMIYGVEKPDEYLTALYGDWRKMPPIDKQKSHHDFLFIDLETSYLNETEKME